MKKDFIIGILLVVIVLGGLFFILFKSSFNSYKLFNSENLITPKKAYEVCYKDHCPNESVVLIGNLTGRFGAFGLFTIDDGNKTVYIDLSKLNYSFLDAIKFHEKNYVADRGVVVAEIKGKIKYNCNTGATACFDTVSISPEEVSVIKKFGCYNFSDGKTSEKIIDCFDYPEKGIKASEAYKKLLKSSICNEDVIGPTGDIEYDNQTGTWRFQVIANNAKVGCIDNCYVNGNVVSADRTCILDKFGKPSHVEEEVK